MKVYKTHIFDKWSKKEGILNNQLCKAVNEILQGLIDADLGGGLVKKRMSKTGQGKRSSYRTLLAFRSNDRALFLTGFAKNEMDNITHDEKILFKKLCHIYLSADIKELEIMCKAKQLIEVNYEKE